jgi:hypothetical protein
MEALYAQKKVKLVDVQSAYEALFLRAVTGFEAFLEARFISILTGAKKYPANKKVAVRMTAPEKAAKAILFQGRPYLDWIPFDRTLKLADIYFEGGRPFRALDTNDMDTIQKITKIRHAIAHQSEHARRKFLDEVVGATPLRPAEKKPAGFLRYQVTPDQNKFEVFIIQLGRIAQELS